MNTPPTINTAPLPMAPVKSSRKQLKKLDIKPKKLMYSEQEGEIISGKANVNLEDPIKRQEKVEILAKLEKNESTESKLSVIHVEQNELENEATQTQAQHPYNLRRRNKNPVYQYTKRETKTKIVKKKIEDNKENEVDIANTSGQNRCSFLSEPDKNKNNWEKLEWLQSRRDVGIWIQCCNKNCEKWRFVEAFHDPVQVPEFWICSMNPNGKFSSCEDPEDPNYSRYEPDLIENEYNAGSLVWGRVNGCPWWPGMVDDCPETLTYYELKGSSQIPARYHITFFEEEALRSWLSTRCIKPLKKDDTAPPVKKPKTIYRGINYADKIKEYLQEAKSAFPLSIKERLEKFSFRTRYFSKNLVNPMTTVPIRKSKKKKPCRIGIKKLHRKKKVNSKISSTLQLPLPLKKATSPEPNLSEITSTPCQPVSMSNTNVEGNLLSQESQYSDLVACSRNNSFDSGLSTPYDHEESMAIIKHFVDNVLARKHKERTGRDLIEDALLYEERLARQKYEDRLYYHLEYDAQSDTFSQANSISRLSKLEERPRISSIPRAVLKKIDNFQELLQQEIAKGLPRN